VVCNPESIEQAVSESSRSIIEEGPASSESVVVVVVESCVVGSSGAVVVCDNGLGLCSSLHEDVCRVEDLKVKSDEGRILEVPAL
jgi:hypothetical protein